MNLDEFEGLLSFRNIRIFIVTDYKYIITDYLILVLLLCLGLLWSYSAKKVLKLQYRAERRVTNSPFDSSAVSLI